MGGGHVCGHPEGVTGDYTGHLRDNFLDKSLVEVILGPGQSVRKYFQKFTGVHPAPATRKGNSIIWSVETYPSSEQQKVLPEVAIEKTDGAGKPSSQYLSSSRVMRSREGVDLHGICRDVWT